MLGLGTPICLSPCFEFTTLPSRDASFRILSSRWSSTLSQQRASTLSNRRRCQFDPFASFRYQSSSQSYASFTQLSRLNAPLRCDLDTVTDCSSNLQSTSSVVARSQSQQQQRLRLVPRLRLKLLLPLLSGLSNHQFVRVAHSRREQ